MIILPIVNARSLFINVTADVLIPANETEANKNLVV